ncbi:Hypothetical_protein [Hexamita inflata]|uniref:Hypothetical_protein n=1 Tax=Hexamita inflata TaxID=28002 RepID=A0AA86Q6C7_9EUKA|nr:Hypothetical protein HINF_LOCUS39718 [Hexamita inflata]
MYCLCSFERIIARAGFCARNAYKNKKCAHFDAHSVQSTYVRMRTYISKCEHQFQFLKNIIQFCQQMLYFELVLLIVILNVVNMLTLQPYEDTQKSYMLE